MKILFNSLLSVVLFYASMCAQAEQMGVKLRAEQWDIPRHGESLIKHKELGKIVRQWINNPEATIEIRYPGGEEGELWVRELMDWLIALGIPSSAMSHLPGSDAEDVINIVLLEKTPE